MNPASDIFAGEVALLLYHKPGWLASPLILFVWHPKLDGLGRIWRKYRVGFGELHKRSDIVVV